MIEAIINAVSIVLEVIILTIKFFTTSIKSIYNSCFGEERDVSDDIILITGAGHGIGKELALQYSALGATIVCWDINDQLNIDTVNLIKSKGKRAFGYTIDVSNRENVFKTAAQVQSEVGNVTIVINNAGILKSEKFLNQTEKDIRTIFDVNIISHFWIIQAFLPKMIERNKGHIVAISSAAGLSGSRFVVPYCSTKFAIRGLMEATSEELRTTSNGKSKIKFTTIYPFLTNTGIFNKVKVRFMKLMPPMEAKDAAAAIIFAQRKGLREYSIPRHWLHMINLLHLFPCEAGALARDFVDSYIKLDNED